MERIILHIDMNSYFATVEQQANPLLRGKSVAVLGSKAKRTIIVASSIEAKRFGVKTGSTLYEAISACPEIVIVHGEPRKYSHVTKKFIEIFERYTDKVEIFSIDEAFLDLTETVHLFGKAETVAKNIKQQIRQEIGAWVSCSVGISYNKFLAKTASDLEKPDGLVTITRKNKDKILLNLPLKEYCGIGKKILKRLGSLDIKNTQNLRDCPDFTLKKEFGIVEGRKLKNMAFGRDNSLVVSWRNQKAAKSFSCSRTLNKDLTDSKEIKKQLFFLFEKVAKKLRDDSYWAKSIGLWLRFKDFNSYGKTMRLGHWSCDGFEFYKLSLKLFGQISLRSPVRAIGVYAGLVQPQRNIPLSFLEEDIKNEKIINLIDTINNHYGEDAIMRACVSGRKLKEVVSGMGRKKF